MKAMIIHEYGTPDTLQLVDRPSPEVGPQDVLIAVHACGLNFADILMLSGQYQERPPFPFGPGMEVAGEIMRVGEAVKHLQPGMRVAALCGHSGFAEEAVAPAASVMPIPDAMTYDEAAAFAVAYGTSHVALAHRGQLKAGETLLVHGAAGGVGLTAVELGAMMGATVIATASSAEKLARAKEKGATHLINYREEPFKDRVKELTGGKGADVIFDPVGGDVFDQSLRCINWEGRLLVIGFAAGRIPAAPANIVLVKNCSVVGVFWGAYSRRNPAVLGDSMKQLLAWYAEGKLAPHISATFPLSQGADALMQLANRKAIGKVVLHTRS